MDLNPE